jgi:hypothetical protein
VGLAPTGKAPPCHGARGERLFLRRHQSMALHPSYHACVNTDSKLCCLQLAALRPCRFPIHRRKPAGEVVQRGSRNRPLTRMTQVAPDASPKAKVPAITYIEFAPAVKSALRDFHSPDLLARNPLLHHGIGNLDGSAGPSELRTPLSETVGTLFGNPRDEKLGRIMELTYLHAAPKQEAAADRLSLSLAPIAATSLQRAIAWRAGCGIVGKPRRRNRVRPERR